MMLGAAALVKLLLVCVQLHAHFDPRDFGIYYAAAVAAHRGLNPYLADLGQVARQFNFSVGLATRATEPPSFIATVLPLAWFPLKTAYWIWFAINLGALIAAIILLLRRGAAHLSPGAVLSFTALALLFPPVADELTYGQSKMLILLLLVLMIRMLESGHERAAGAMLAIAGLLRAFPFLLLVYFLYRGRRRLVAWAIGASVLGGIITLLTVGIGNSFGFIFHALGFLSGSTFRMNPSNISIKATLLRWFALALGHPLGGWASFVTISFADAAVLALLFSATPAAGCEDRDWCALSSWIAASVALSPTAWMYDLCFLLIPLLLLAPALVRGSVDRRIAFVAITVYALPTVGAATTMFANDRFAVVWLQNLYFATFAAAIVAALLLPRAEPAPAG